MPPASCVIAFIREAHISKLSCISAFCNFLPADIGPEGLQSLHSKVANEGYHHVTYLLPLKMAATSGTLWCVGARLPDLFRSSQPLGEIVGFNMTSSNRMLGAKPFPLGAHLFRTVTSWNRMGEFQFLSPFDTNRCRNGQKHPFPGFQMPPRQGCCFGAGAYRSSAEFIDISGKLLWQCGGDFSEVTAREQVPQLKRSRRPNLVEESFKLQ